MPWNYAFRGGNLSRILRWNKIGLRRRRRRRRKKRKRKRKSTSFHISFACSRWYLTRFTGKCNVSCLTSCLFPSYRCALAKRNVIELKCFLCSRCPSCSQWFSSTGCVNATGDQRKWKLSLPLLFDFSFFLSLFFLLYWF